MRTFQQEPRQSKGARPSSRTILVGLARGQGLFSFASDGIMGDSSLMVISLPSAANLIRSSLPSVRIKIGLELGLSEMGV
jgi:hypothetical protein